MEKFRKLCWIISAFCLTVSGCCSRSPKPSPPNLVACVQVSYDHDAVHLRRTYTSTEKMDKVLFYLYSLSPYDGRSNAEANIGQQCRITVILTNGDTRVYRQRDGQYLSVDESPWQRIDPEKSCRLFPLLARMCSDEEQQNFRLSG